MVRKGSRMECERAGGEMHGHNKLKRIKNKMHSVYGSIESSEGAKKERNMRFYGLKIGNGEMLCTFMWPDRLESLKGG
jgi:hypothetical protein